MNKEEFKSYIIVISSMLIFGTIGIFRRYIPMTSGLLACARGIIGGTCLCLWLKLRGQKIRHGIGSKKTLQLVFIGALIGINWILLFEAYNYTTVATATLCYYMQPTIVLLLSPLIFHEKLTIKKLICAGLGILGMFFVSGMMEGNGVHIADARGIIMGLMAAVLYASVIIMNKIVQIDDVYERTVIQLYSAALVMIPYLIYSVKSGNSLMLSTGNHAYGMAILMLIIVGIIHTGLAYALYFGGMGGLKSQSIAVLSYIDPVFALILSAAFLHENMTIFGMIGAVLIIGSALVSELGK